MNIFHQVKVRSLVLASLFSVHAVAAPLIVDSHIGQQGPRYEALMTCLTAIQNSDNMGHGLRLSTRVGSEAGPDGKVLILHGTTWQNGARVPVAVRCALSRDRRSVASLTRIDATPEMLARAK